MTTSVLSHFHRLAYFAAVLTIVLPVVILLSWIEDPTLLSSLPSSFHTIKPNTAVGLLLCGTALLLQIHQPLTRLRRRIARICGMIACLLAAATLCEYLFSIDLSIDRWSLFTPDVTEDPHPSRMAPPTAFAILMLGISLLRLDRVPVSRHDPAQYAALIGSTIGGVALVGYFYGVQSLYKVGLFSTIPLTTAILLTAIGLGILSARPERGFMATLASEDLGAA